jgi:putative transposase
MSLPPRYAGNLAARQNTGYSRFTLRPTPRTFFITTVTAKRRALLQDEANAALLSDLLFRFRDEGRYFLHAFVVMPDHVHALITPSYDHSVERCVQCIKGGFSHALDRGPRLPAEVWKKGFEHRPILNSEEYTLRKSHIAQNPERWGFQSHKHVHVSGPELDAMPRHLRC